MHLYRLEVTPNDTRDYSQLEKSIWDKEDKHFKILKEKKVYLIETAEPINLDDMKPVFYDPIIETIASGYKRPPQYCRVATVLYKPGVTDNSGLAAEEALALIGINARVATGKVYEIESPEENDALERLVERYLMNTLIQQADVHDSFHDNFESIQLPHVKLEPHSQLFEYIDIYTDADSLKALSHDRCLALSLTEFYHIQSHFQDADIVAAREAGRLLSHPTDVELEVIAQSWSEHCKHKIFSAEINYKESITDQQYKQLGSKIIHSLYKTYIKDATHRINEEGCDWTVSVFSDNAGIVNFDKYINCCIKVETHNSPSALDPYGGAITGILGVNRDILGCGMGAKPVANTNVLCFADPRWPTADEKDLLPKGPRTPAETLTGVHKGIEDGGNKSGIPTVNGAFYFDYNYAGKPLVYCGTVGVLPKQLDDGRDAAFKHVRVGDRILMVGGAIGADGIHGATFSSLELDEHAPATAVQIGEPLVQKRMTDFLLDAQRQCLFTGLTDNGAGGLSSSVGEMAQETNGAHIDVAKCPTKYPGLLPYELVISESQERMTVAVNPLKVDAFIALAKAHGVVATDIGEFTDTGFFTIDYADQRVAHLSLDFLHDSLPPMRLKATWDQSCPAPSWGKVCTPAKQRDTIDGKSPLTMLSRVLGALNVASKEKWIRRYDHEVGAATQLKPLQGTTHVSPNNSGVIALEPHGGEANNGITIGCGLNPRLSLYDPYYMAQVSVDEAIRNVIAVGADPKQICILDNFCWPDPVESLTNPEGAYRLGQLVRASAGLYDSAVHFGSPIVSGKDSMKNNFSGVNQNGDKINIAVLPTLLVTSMGKVDCRHVMDSAFKRAGDKIYLLGESKSGLAYSEFAECFDIESHTPTYDPEHNKTIYQHVHAMISHHLIESCHDISDGGLLTAVAESCFCNLLGAELSVKTDLPELDHYFGESCGRFIVSVSSANEAAFLELIQQIPYQLLGQVTDNQQLILNGQQASIEALYQTWSTQFENI